LFCHEAIPMLIVEKVNWIVPGKKKKKMKITEMRVRLATDSYWLWINVWIFWVAKKT
tara:strand:- start:153 stop:323 length:171 start_codon:yes stop_codon:yes gene_type:complete